MPKVYAKVKVTYRHKDQPNVALEEVIEVPIIHVPGRGMEAREAYLKIKNEITHDFNQKNITIDKLEVVSNE